MTAIHDLGDSDVAAALTYAARLANGRPDLTLPLENEERADIALVRVPVGDKVETLDFARYLDRPRRKVGTVAVHNGEAFTEYWRKHADDGSELWAQETAYSLVGVLDAHEATGGPVGPASEPGEDGARWAVHRVQLTLSKTKDWKAWEGGDNGWFGQVDFAEFIESYAHTFVHPDALTMLELAQNFQATKGAVFAGGTRLDNGQRRFSYNETVEGSAGINGQLEIPARITLAIEPFETLGIRHEIGARFRYRIGSQGLKLGYILDNPTDTLREAYRGIVGAVEAALGTGAWRGVPLPAGTPA